MYRIIIISFLFISIFLQADVDKETSKINLTQEELHWIEEHPSINFTGDPNWLPFEAFNREGKYIGIIAGLLDIIESRSPLKFNRMPTKSW